ncbi:MAG: hypothetical protein ABSG14_04630, partial [Verrucomicrobiia bacterium]
FETCLSVTSNRHRERPGLLFRGAVSPVPSYASWPSVHGRFSSLQAREFLLGFFRRFHIQQEPRARGPQTEGVPTQRADSIIAVSVSLQNGVKPPVVFLPGDGADDISDRVGEPFDLFHR